MAQAVVNGYTVLCWLLFPAAVGTILFAINSRKLDFSGVFSAFYDELL